LKSLLVGIVCILTTLVILLRLITLGADTTPIKLVSEPVKDETFTPFAKPSLGGPVLRYDVRQIGGWKAIPPPRLPHFRPLRRYMSSESCASNSRGQVVGVMRLYGSGAWLQISNHAFLHSQDITYDLGALPGYAVSGAATINESGMIAGDSFEGSNTWEGGDELNHAVCWTHRRIRDLGEGTAACINNSGDIAGTSGSGRYDCPHAPHALLWTHGYRYDLNECPPPHSGWVLSTATDINDKGQIAGYGLFHGKDLGFLLTPDRRTNS
jgi:hypothetical protein